MIAFAARHLLQRFLRHSCAGFRPAAAVLALGMTGLLAACGGGGGGGGSPTPTPTPTPTATLNTITVTPATPSATLGVAPATVALTATGTYSDGTTKVLTTTAAWTSSTTTIATVGASTGIVTPVAAGTTKITAVYAGVMSPAVTFTVNPAPVTLTSIAVSPTTASIAKGLKQIYSAIGTYSDGSHQTITSTVTWASGTPTVATISSAGVATGTGIGTAAITASLGTITSAATGTATLTVTPATLVSVAINPTGPTIAVGKTQQFSLIGTFTDASTQDYTTATGVTWASSNTATATISNTAPTIGLATTLAIGTTSISINGNAYNGQTVAPVTLTVSATVYAYATNFGENTVSEYVIGAGGSANPGALTPLPTPTIAAGLKPFSVSVEPTGQYAYVANYGSASVSEYTIGTGGQLSPVGAGTVATGSYPNGVTIDPADKHAYVANLKDSTVSQFSIGTDGVLNPLTPATVSTLPTSTGVTNPSTIAIEPYGKYAYVANFGDEVPAPPTGPSTITQYTVNADGTLTLNSAPTAVSGSGPNAIVFVAVSPTVEYAYVVNVGDGTVSQYSIAPTGALTPLSPPTVASGNGLTTTKPFGLAVNPAGTYLYVANAGEGTISQFSISPTTGALTSIGTAVASGSGVSSVTVDATGKYVYGTNRSTNTISQFAINTQTGVLTPMTAPTVTSGTTPTSSPTSIATGY
jgi:6-phosphogluconolactonase (cycloisomerase 2 family)